MGHHNNFAEGEIFSARPITMITRLLRQPFFKTTIKEKTKCLGIDISFAINILLIPNPKLYFYFFHPPLKYPPPRNKKIKFSFIDIFRKLLKKPHIKHTNLLISSYICLKKKIVIPIKLI